jgi:glycosyltransferase involved in cell wall biosynthesis
MRPAYVKLLKDQCMTATCAAYVTREYLQRHYPTEAEFTTSYSSIGLPADLFSFVNERRKSRPGSSTTGSKNRTLVFVGSLAQRYKGLNFLLHAMRFCTDKGLNLNLSVLGDGLHRSEYEHLASKLGLEEKVKFYGYVPPGREVLSKLCESDLFVMPSLAEGLPRAMIEAMACGLPCIGTRIGGIPELLPSEDLVPPGDVRALANKIEEVLTNPERATQMISYGLEKAEEYLEENLRARRVEFYSFLRERTEHRMRTR